LGSLFGFLSYVNFIAVNTRNSLKNQLHAVSDGRATPGVPGRKRVNKMQSVTAFHRLLRVNFRNLTQDDCRGRPPAVWSMDCPE
jgi:hypothetical protein